VSRKLAGSCIVLAALGIAVLWFLRDFDRAPSGAAPQGPREAATGDRSSVPSSANRVEQSAASGDELGIENYPPGERRTLNLSIHPTKDCEPLPGRLLVLSSLEVSDELSGSASLLDVDQAAEAWREVKGPLLGREVDWTQRAPGQDLLRLEVPIPAKAIWARVLAVCPNARGELLVDLGEERIAPIALELEAAGALDLTVVDASRAGVDAEEMTLTVFGSSLVDDAQRSRSPIQAQRTFPIGRTISLEGLPLGFAYDVRVVAASGGEARLRDWHPTACARSAESLVIPPSSSVSGRVTDGEGHPIQGALIGLNLQVMGVETRGGTTTDSGGRYRAEFYGAGRVSLSVAKPGFQPHLESLGAMQVGEGIENVDVVLAPSPTLSGTVRREDGSAVARALVYFRDPDKGFDRVQDSTADEQGRFTLQVRSGLPVVLWALAAEPEPNVPVEASQPLLVSEPSEALELVVARPRGGVRGLVRDDAGGIAAPCTVSARLLGDVRGTVLDRIARTDDAGAFSLEGLVDGRWRIEAALDGHRTREPQWVEILAATVLVDLVLERPGGVRGSVVDASGARVQHAEVSFAAPLSSDWPVWRPSGSSEATWEGDGTFRIAGLAPGLYKVLARVPGRAYGESGPIVVLPGTTADAGTIVVTDLGAIRGRVVDAASGTGAAGVQLACRLIGDLGLPFPAMTTASESGTFEFQGLRPGLQSVELVVRQDGQSPGGAGTDGTGDMRLPSRVVEVRPGETAEVQLLMNEQPAVVLEGIADGAFDRRQLAVELHPLEGPEDVFHPYARATIEAGGRFRLTSRATGWHLLAFGPNTTKPIHEEVLQLHEGLNTCLVQIPKGSLSGRVLDSGALAPTRHRVQLECMDAEARSGWQRDRQRVEEAGLDGRFVFESLEPGRYILRAGGFVDAIDATTASVIVSDILVEADAETKVGDLVLETGNVLLGSTVDSVGQAVPDAEVLVWNLNGELVRRPARSDHVGRFRIQGLAATDYLVASRTATSACGPELFPVRSSGAQPLVVLRLSPVPVVSLEVSWSVDTHVNPSMLQTILRGERKCVWPRSGAAIRLWAAFPDPSGHTRLEFGSLPPGSYRLELASSNGLRASRALELDAIPGPRVERLELTARER